MKRKMILAAILALTTSFLCCLPVMAESAKDEKLCTITLGIEYAENMLVNTYDLVCYLDEAELATLSQGDKIIISVQAPAGQHTFRVVGQNKQKSSDKISVNASSDVCFSVSCKAKWNGLSITRFDVATDEDSISMIKNTDLLGSLQDLVTRTLNIK